MAMLAGERVGVSAERVTAAGASIRELSPAKLGWHIGRRIEEIVYVPEPCAQSLDLLDPKRLDFAGASISVLGVEPSGFNGQLERLIVLTGDENAVRRAEVSFFLVPPQNRIEVG